MFIILVMIIIGSLIEAVYYFKLAGYMFSKGKKRAPLQIDLRQKILFSFLALSLILIGIAPMMISGFLLDAGSVMLDGKSYVTMLVGG
jgi:NADH:ubiquinone oxidoreductase subunit 2 (subunit N)